jgi:hypothetical protein
VNGDKRHVERIASRLRSEPRRRALRDRQREMRHKMMNAKTAAGDLVKATISEQQFIIEQLEHCISGQRD